MSLRALEIRRWAGPVTAALALTLAACGGSSNSGSSSPTIAPTDAAGASTPTSAPPTSTPAPPTATSTPEPPTSTPTPEPPTATPTPAVKTFSTADSGGGTASGKHSGVLGIVFSDGEFGYDASKNQVQVYAFINVGSGETPSATGYVENAFRAPTIGSGIVHAHVSGAVTWKGVLAGAGVGGTKAAVSIELKVLDSNGKTVATKEVHSKELAENVLTVGGFDDDGSDTADFVADVVPGNSYQVRLEATCEARSGLISGSTHCVFGPSDTYSSGYVRWTELSVTFSGS